MAIGDGSILIAPQLDALHNRGRQKKLTDSAVELVSANYTLDPEDGSVVLRVDSAIDVTVTLPRWIAEGMVVTVVQANDGKAVFQAGEGATIVSRTGLTRTAGKYAVMSIVVDRNVDGRSANFILLGDGIA